MKISALVVAVSLACLTAGGVEAWRFLPPRDVDPKLGDLANPIPRRWSGQKASLAFAELTRGDGAITLDWSAAAEVKRAPKLPGDPRSLWKGRTPPKLPVTEPRLYAVGRDLRLFRDALPPVAELLPFVVVVDGNPEDGYGGYVLGTDGEGEWSLARTETSVTLRGPVPVAHRFDGNWIAGLQAAARAWPARFAAPDGMSADLWISVIAEWVQDVDKWNAPVDGWAEFLAQRRARRARLLADPRLAATLEKGILFCTRRNPSWNHCVAQYFGWRQRPGGSLLVLERPGRSLATRDVLAGRMPSGTCLEPRLSFDARTALFAFVETQGPLDPFSMPVNERGGDDHYFHLWRVNMDGSGLAQLTKGVYEDFMPCWLPDGDVAFMSTRRRSQSRCFWYGYSNRWQAYTLFRMKADGSDIRQLSWNDVAEWFPALSAEGEILFARWDYIDRDAVRHQNLWSMRPDGTNPKAVWGNETPSPHCLFQPCAVPGSGKIACIASAHHAVTGGPLVLIDPSVDENSEAAVTHVTPGHYPECADRNKHDYDDPSPAAHNDWYNSPWAYGEDLFLICWSRDPMGYEPSRPIPDAALGLYVLAADGTRELLWRDGQYGAAAPQPLVPRAAPPLVRSQLDPSLAAAKKGEVFISDVARGLPGAPTGTVRRVRVVELYPRTAPDQYLPLLGAGGHENGRGVIGTADVEADGSARFLVPAEKQLFFQVLDADGFTWRTMRSSTSVMPGERVSCVGCHEPKREASATAKRLAVAMQRPAQELAVPPEGGRPWGFTENVQPIFDRKCVSCHSGEKAPKGVALTREEDPRFPSRTRVKGVFGAKDDRLDWGMVCAPFSRAYATLIFTDEKTGKGSDYKPFQRWKRRRGTDRAGRPADMVPCWPEYNPVQTTPEGPGNNALGSGLMGHLLRGKHAALLTPEERRMIATWIDLNALFYSCCEEPGLSRQFRGEPVAYPERLVVTDAGADPTGRADSTPAMQACIDRVAAAGGGTVSVPPGEYRISFLTLRPHVTLELAGGAGRATDGWTPEAAARAMDPSQSAIIRSVADRKGRWWLFLFNLVPPTAATNGFSDITVSGGVFDCEGRYLPGAFACGRNIRLENMVVKDLPNNHAFQIDGCTNVVVANCLFAGYTFGGKHKVLTRETIQVEQTSPGALSGNPTNTPISCAREVSIPNRNVSVTGCWFGPSERLGPHLIPLGHHGRPRSCDGLVFAGNVVVNPLYCGVRLANVSDVRVEGNTFVSTNASPRLAKDSAVVCLWGKQALAPGEKGVVIRGNRVVLAPESPLRRLWVSEPRKGEVSAEKDGL